MKILVTGATGFLGSHLVRALVAEGHNVIILKRKSSNIKRIADLISEINYYNLETSDLDHVFNEHGIIDTIIHTSTCYGRNEEKASEIFEANTLFPLRLLEMGVLYGTKTFFNADTFFSKNKAQYNYLNNYSLSKKQFLESAQQFALTKKIRLINIKLEHMYGPQDDISKFTSHVINSCINNVLELKLTPGEQLRDFIYIDDVIAAFLILLKQKRHESDYFEEYELGSGSYISIRGFAELVHRITESKTKLIFGDIPYRENELMKSKANIQKLLALGWRPNKSIESGLEATVDWEKNR